MSGFVIHGDTGYAGSLIAYEALACGQRQYRGLCQGQGLKLLLPFDTAAGTNACAFCHPVPYYQGIPKDRRGTAP